MRPPGRQRPIRALAPRPGQSGSEGMRCPESPVLRPPASAPALGSRSKQSASVPGPPGGQGSTFTRPRAGQAEVARCPGDRPSGGLGGASPQCRRPRTGPLYPAARRPPQPPQAPATPSSAKSPGSEPCPLLPRKRCPALRAHRAWLLENGRRPRQCGCFHLETALCDPHP